jgi:hypothetical protein
VRSVGGEGEYRPDAVIVSEVGVKRKGGRKMAQKADEKAQEAWKRGVVEAL